MQNNLFQVRKKLFKILDSVKDLLELMRQKSLERNSKISIIKNLKDNQIYNDANRIQQVLVNFISNSLKFTKNGEIFIALIDLDSFTMEIEIINNGSGIKKEKYGFFMKV
jgi:signal transduction histidine kinase